MKAKALGLLALGLVSMDAHAYLDPGTGSMIVQGIIAAIAMVSITAKVYWHRILVFLGLREKIDSEETTEPSVENTDSVDKF